MFDETIKRLQRKGQYTRKIRPINEIETLGDALYEPVIKKFNGFNKKLKNAYEGLENSPSNPKDKLPNITCMWNLPMESNGYIYGSSMGHTHNYDEIGIQEIYEFLGWGGMLISSNEGVKLHVCKPGSKVIVPYNCMMTILNFSFRDLTTLDMANPNKNKSSKDILKQNKGPMLIFYHKGISPYSETVDFKDFKEETPVGGIVRLELNPNYEEFKSSTQSLDIRTRASEPSLCAALIENKEQLQERGIELIIAESKLIIPGKNGTKFNLDLPLANLVKNKNRPLQKILGLD